MDMVTGDTYTLAFSPDVKGRHFVGDIAWAPDNYHLVAIGKTVAFPHCAPNCMDDVNGLYLVDFISGKADLIFPSFQIFWRRSRWKLSMVARWNKNLGKLFN